ncbi:hypothetical protein THAOC_21982 [Thalassiosira oceanica]|uniref:Peptidase S33 tripeptidyl aminopeptidase-like C-terminal domain-containing protein n=1 Tax=Thalassiosira oceanica TaxID=159749 RepID=K0RZJ0_THAOC|nr:hypothetical protein THAOC_21982 [Thalassiosira oceanica]|eukprot:EJK57934.1 hypothetical protein THAOC_21982 [Thalassiosira oceanica]
MKPSGRPSTGLRVGASSVLDCSTSSPVSFASGCAPGPGARGVEDDGSPARRRVADYANLVAVRTQDYLFAIYSEDEFVDRVVEINRKYPGAGTQVPATILAKEFGQAYFTPNTTPSVPMGNPQQTGIVAGQLYDPATNYYDTQLMRQNFPLSSLLTSRSVNHGIGSARANGKADPACQAYIQRYFKYGEVDFVDGHVCESDSITDSCSITDVMSNGRCLSSSSGAISTDHSVATSSVSRRRRTFSRGVLAHLSHVVVKVSIRNLELEPFSPFANLHELEEAHPNDDRTDAEHVDVPVRYRKDDKYASDRRQDEERGRPVRDGYPVRSGEVLPTKPQLHEGRVLEQERDRVDGVEELEEGLEVRRAEDDDDAGAEQDPDRRRPVPRRPPPEDPGEVAPLGHPHELERVGRELGLEEAEVRYARGEYHPGAQPPAPYVDRHPAEEAVDPLLLRVVRRAHGHHQRHEVGRDRHDQADEHPPRVGPLEVGRLARERRRRVERVEVPEEVVEVRPPQDPAERGRGQRTGRGLEVVVEEGRLAVFRRSHRRPEPPRRHDPRQPHYGENDEGAHGQEAEQNRGPTHDLESRVVQQGQRHGHGRLNSAGYTALSVAPDTHPSVPASVAAAPPNASSTHATPPLAPGRADPSSAVTSASGDRPDERTGREAEDGEEVPPGPDGGLDPERPAAHVVEDEDGQGTTGRGAGGPPSRALLRRCRSAGAPSTHSTRRDETRVGTCLSPRDVGGRPGLPVAVVVVLPARPGLTSVASDVGGRDGGAAEQAPSKPPADRSETRLHWHSSTGRGLSGYPSAAVLAAPTAGVGGSSAPRPRPAASVDVRRADAHVDDSLRGSAVGAKPGVVLRDRGSSGGDGGPAADLGGGACRPRRARRITCGTGGKPGGLSGHRRRLGALVAMRCGLHHHQPRQVVQLVIVQVVFRVVLADLVLTSSSVSRSRPASLVCRHEVFVSRSR